MTTTILNFQEHAVARWKARGARYGAHVASTADTDTVLTSGDLHRDAHRVAIYVTRDVPKDYRHLALTAYHDGYYTGYVEASQNRAG